MSLLVLRSSSITPTPPLLSLSSSSSSSTLAVSTNTCKNIAQPSTLAVSTNTSSRLDNKNFNLNSKLFNGLGTHTPLMIKERRSMILKASEDVSGTGSDTPEASSESEDENAQVENLPLESKLQLKLEQKMKMKLTKKIRLRRKKLVRKRRLRKKGRWPPSKMKKNKNV